MNNLDRWNACKINPNKQAAFNKVAQRLLSNKARYQTVEKRTGVPWWFIAVVHEREASGNFRTQLGQGDPLNQVSTHVPKGRGPFATWEDGAFDALVKTAPFAARQKDWSIGAALDMLEKYNGLGYKKRGIPSPYLWAGTNQYTRGKFIADGVFSASAVDQQLGCAGLLKAMGVGSIPTIAHAGGATAGLGFLAGTWEQVQQHPFIFGIIAVALGLATFFVIRKLKGK
ncbi:MAG TPA: hypothetical protein VFV08_05865 [Puia sp.]|nr:hypothetical protein [Puia sp.]